MTDRARFRLFVTSPLSPEAAVELPREQAHYLSAVMRARLGEPVLLFNGSDGEWLAEIEHLAKNAATLRVTRLTRAQAPEPDLWLLAAPIKKDRVDWVAEKASELGISALWPIITRRTVVSRVNTDRLAAHLLEAAEQCERLTLPELKAPMPLDRALAAWEPERVLLFLDESGSGPALAEVVGSLPPNVPMAVLIGPEGGFAPEEREMLARSPFAKPASLGPRILRADTAAIAALAIVQSLRGDWASPPRGWKD